MPAGDTSWLGADVVVDGQRGLVCLDNGDGTWNVEFEDGTERDVAAGALAPAEPAAAAPARGPPGGARVVTDWAQPRPDGWTRFVCFSDTHGLHDQIPPKHLVPADVLLHAGDFSNTGELEQVESLATWLEKYPAKRKIVIAGNHDTTFDLDYYYRAEGGAARFHRGRSYDATTAKRLLQRPSVTYLEDEACEVEGYTVYGTPWQPEFCDWAFNLPRGKPLQEKWALIPKSVDVLLTHGPAYGLVDMTSRGERVGCADLAAAVQRRAVGAVVSGHVHEGYGVARDEKTLFVNASTCTHAYRPTNPPVVFDLPPPAELRAAAARA